MKHFSMRRGSVIRGVTVSVLLLLALVCSLVFCGRGCACGIFVKEAIRSNLARNRLLCKTNHHALLAASRDLWKMTAEGKLKPGVYRVGRHPPSPEISHFPKLILDLAPELVTIDERGYVVVEMRACGFDNCGVTAYSEDFQIPYPGFKGGQRMLIEGLWYYDSEYTGDPAYDKVIDKLVRRGKNGVKS